MEMSEVKMIEFTKDYGVAKCQQVALFDGRDLSEEEANKLIRSEEYSDEMVVMEKKQFETIFRSLKEKDTEELINAYDYDGNPLPPCPFCGGTTILFEKYRHKTGSRWRVICADCMAEIDPGWAQDPHVLIPMWKKRATPLHANWIDTSTKPSVNCGKKCSHCGARITNREHVAGTHPFCHKCGAIMDNAGEIKEKIKSMIGG